MVAKFLASETVCFYNPVTLTLEIAQLRLERRRCSSHHRGVNRGVRRRETTALTLFRSRCTLTLESKRDQSKRPRDSSVSGSGARGSPTPHRKMGVLGEGDPQHRQRRKRENCRGRWQSICPPDCRLLACGSALHALSDCAHLHSALPIFQRMLRYGACRRSQWSVSVRWLVAVAARVVELNWTLAWMADWGSG